LFVCIETIIKQKLKRYSSSFATVLIHSIQFKTTFDSGVLFGKKKLIDEDGIFLVAWWN